MKSSQKKIIRIVVTGGGSGGHVAPLKAVVPVLQQKYGNDLVCTWIGSKQFEEDAANDLGVGFKKIHSGKLRRYFSWQNLFDAFKVEAAFWQSLYYLIRLRPRVVVSTGGFVSVPVVIAAWFLYIPVITHEQTIALGLANKINAYFSKKILLGFEDSKNHFSKSQQKKITVVGNPIRKSVMGGDFDGLQESFSDLNFENDKPLLYITGGSQGSSIMNEIVWNNLEYLLETFMVIHQCGKNGVEKSKEIFAQLNKEQKQSYWCGAFVKAELKHVYACADVVFARSGAGTVNELAVFRIPSVFVPLAIAQQNEQFKNAQWFLKQPDCDGEIIEEHELTDEKLQKAFVGILRYSDQLRRYRDFETITMSIDKSTIDFVKEIESLL